VCTSAANKCLLKVAQYAAQVEHYEKAIDIYEQVDKPTYTYFTDHFSGPGRAFGPLCVYDCLDNNFMTWLRHLVHLDDV